jgi:hypothetical protein
VLGGALRRTAGSTGGMRAGNAGFRTGTGPEMNRTQDDGALPRSGPDGTSRAPDPVGARRDTSAAADRFLPTGMCGRVIRSDTRPEGGEDPDGTPVGGVEAPETSPRPPLRRGAVGGQKTMARGIGRVT